MKTIGATLYISVDSSCNAGATPVLRGNHAYAISRQRRKSNWLLQGKIVGASDKISDSDFRAQNVPRGVATNVRSFAAIVRSEIRLFEVGSILQDMIRPKNVVLY